MPRRSQTNCTHFGPSQLAGKTVLKNTPYYTRYPEGTKALLFGGNNGPESNFVLRDLVTTLQLCGIGYQYSDTTGANIDSNGNFFLYQKDGGNPNK